MTDDPDSSMKGPQVSITDDATAYANAQDQGRGSHLYREYDNAARKQSPAPVESMLSVG